MGRTLIDNTSFYTAVSGEALSPIYDIELCKSLSIETIINPLVSGTEVQIVYQRTNNSDIDVWTDVTSPIDWKEGDPSVWYIKSEPEYKEVRVKIQVTQGLADVIHTAFAKGAY